MYREPYYELHWGNQYKAAWRPPTDVYETDDSAVVMVEIAGLNEGDYEVSLAGRALVVAGERSDPVEKLAYQQMEIRYGKFRTQVYLPWPIDGTNIDAHYENGFLKILLRKAQPHRIPVQVVDENDKGL